MLRGREMEGHPAGFVKLGLADQPARGPLIKQDIWDQQVAGFTWTQSGAGQQPEQRLMGSGAQGASWTQPSGFVKDAADVCRGEETGVRTTGRRQKRALRNLGLRQTRLQVEQKPAGGTQTRMLSGGATDGRRAAGPVHRKVGTNRVAVAVLCEVRHKVLQKPSDGAGGKTQRLPEREIGIESGLQLVDGHGAPPGQGNATCAKAARSSLA